MKAGEDARAAGIAALRAEIDAVDDAIVGLLAARASRVAALWRAKTEAGMHVRDPAREDAVFARLRAGATAAGLDPDAVDAVFRRVVGAPLSAELAAACRRA